MNSLGSGRECGVPGCPVCATKAAIREKAGQVFKVEVLALMRKTKTGVPFVTLHIPGRDPVAVEVKGLTLGADYSKLSEEQLQRAAEKAAEGAWDELGAPWAYESRIP